MVTYIQALSYAILVAAKPHTLCYHIEMLSKIVGWTNEYFNVNGVHEWIHSKGGSWVSMATD